MCLNEDFCQIYNNLKIMEVDHMLFFLSEMYFFVTCCQILAQCKKTKRFGNGFYIFLCNKTSTQLRLCTLRTYHFERYVKFQVAPFQQRKLGTLLGVYLPTVQNIFGVLIFIRVTWIVGMAGTIEGFLIIFLCCCTVSKLS